MAAAKKKKRLYDLKAMEVSFVPKGANQRDILLTKEDKEMDEILKELLESKFENEAELDAKIMKSLPEEIQKNKDEVSKIQATMKAALKLLQGVGKRLPQGGEAVMQQMQDLMGKKKEVSKEADEPADRTKFLEELKKEGYTIEAPKKPEEEDMGDGVSKEYLEKVLKERDDANEKVVKELKDEKEKLQKELKEEKDLRIQKEFEAEARKMGYVGDRAVEIAKTLKEAKEGLSEDSYKSVRKELEQKAQMVRDSSIFKELGSGAGNDGDVVSKIDAKVSEIRKENPELTKEMAEAELMEREPDLYNEYLQANPAQGGY